MSKAQKWSVMVIDLMCENRFSCVGEIVVETAILFGLAGVVVDGPSTDTRPQKEIGLPVFSTGRSAVTTIIGSVEGDYNIPGNCGGVVAKPGDIVNEDTDCIIVSEPSLFEGLVEKGETAGIEEMKIRKDC